MIQQVEFAILDWIQTHLRCNVLDALFPVFTSLANHGEIWIALAVILLFWKRHRQTGLALGAGLLIDMVVCNLTLKPLIGRIRPFAVNTAVELLVKAPHDASFPSAVSFAAAGALWAMGNPLWKPATVVAALMAASRLYLYVHWPTDVLAGVAVGWVCGWLGAMIVKRTARTLEKRKNEKTAG